MTRVLTVATRRGELAGAQTQIVVAALRHRHPGLDIRIREMTSAGDRDRRTALWDLKDTGFFTSSLETALVACEADIAVHSYKDLPTRPQEGLVVAAVLDRRSPEDCLVANGPIDSVEGLRAGARIGTSSLRRAAQLRHLRNDLELVPIRGNVRTRIERLRTEGLDAVVLARAGLERLDRADAVSLVFDRRQFIPAPAQGALAVQVRQADEMTREVVAVIDDPLSRAATDAERQVLTTLRCGCHAPVGAYAECDGQLVTVYAFLSDVGGEKLLRARTTGPVAEACDVGAAAAGELLDAGGREILDELEKEKADRGIDT